MLDFININKIALKEIKTAFFSVNLVARKKNKNFPSTNPYLINFLALSELKPTFLDVFAGRLNYKRYPFIDMILIKLIMLITKGPLKSSTNIEYTNWKRVVAFAHKIIKAIQN